MKVPDSYETPDALKRRGGAGRGQHTHTHTHIMLSGELEKKKKNWRQAGCPFLQIIRQEIIYISQPKV